MASLTLDNAQKIIRKTWEKGKEMELKPLSTIVLEASSHEIAFEWEDEAARGRFCIAHGKAHGSVILCMPGNAQMVQAEQQAYFMVAVYGI